VAGWQNYAQQKSINYYSESTIIAQLSLKIVMGWRSVCIKSARCLSHVVH